MCASGAIQLSLRHSVGAIAKIAGLLGLICIAAGCAGYQLGPTNGVVAGSKSVQINLFKNELLEPRLSEAVATALRRSVQQDGTYLLDTHQEGDLIVNGSMIKLDRSALSFQAADVLTPRDYNLTLITKVTITEARSDKVIFDGTINGRTTIRAGNEVLWRPSYRRFHFWPQISRSILPRSWWMAPGEEMADRTRQIDPP